jgi:hypothetical protein
MVASYVGLLKHGNAVMIQEKIETAMEEMAFRDTRRQPVQSAESTL